MGAGGGQSQSSKTTTEPWAQQKPYLEHGMSEAARLYHQGPAQYYPGQTYTNMSDATQAGLAGQVATAMDGNAVVNNAAGNVADTTAGKYLSPESNPYLAGTFRAAADDLNRQFTDTTMPALGAMFGGDAGNSSLALAAGSAAGDHSRQLRDLASDIYGGNYQQERSRQMTAAGMAPGLRDAQFGDATKLQDAGAKYEHQAGKVLEDDINRWNYAQNADQSALQDYMSLVSGNLGSTSTSRTSGSNTGSPINSALGAASMMASGMGGK